MADAALHPADEMTYVRGELDACDARQITLTRREEALAAALVADRELRVGSLHHAVVERVRGRDVVDVHRLPDLRAVHDALHSWSLVVDVETTGLDPDSDRIISVALRPVRLHRGTVLTGSRLNERLLVDSRPAFCCTVNPGRPSSAEALAIHGQTEEALAHGQPFTAYAREIEDYIAGEHEAWPAPLTRPVIIAHHAPFDLAFLGAEMERAGLDRPDPRTVLDTRVLAMVLWPGARGSLDALADRLGVDRMRYRADRHTAVDDIDLLRACLPALADEIAGRLA